MVEAIASPSHWLASMIAQANLWQSAVGKSVFLRSILKLFSLETALSFRLSSIFPVTWCDPLQIGSKDIFMFDLNAKQYWYFVKAAKNASCFTFEIGQSSSSILVGTKFGSIFTVNLRKFVRLFLWSIHLFTFFHLNWTCCNAFLMISLSATVKKYPN